MFNRYRLRQLFSSAVFATIFIVLVDECHARLGGGGGFSGGRRSGGSSGGSGDGVALYYLIRLAFRYPLIGIPVLLLVVYVMYKQSTNAKGAYQGHVIRKAVVHQNRSTFNRQLNQLQSSEPDFDQFEFINRVKASFITLQTAWTQGDLNTIRNYVTDSTFERFFILNQMYKDNGIIDVMKDVKVLESEIISIKSDQHYDTIQVKILASAVNYFTDRGGRRVTGSTTAEEFVELWSFLRKRGVKSLSSKGLMSGFCPNCGTPLRLNDKAECESCSALVSSGQYDWVLAEITQPELSVNPDGNYAHLFKELELKDPGFNLQAIEDKVSTAFWALRYSEFDNNFQSLKRFTTPELHADIAQNRGAGQWNFVADPAIGGVDVFDFIPATTDEFDRLKVKVTWSGHSESRKQGQTFIPDYRQSAVRFQEFVLKRHQSVKTPFETSLMTLHCPNCGAPANKISAADCNYCGTSFVDGSRDWVIEEINRFGGYRQRVEFVQKPIAPGTEELLIAVIYSMLADGVVDPKERKSLSELSAKVQYPEMLLDGLIQNVKSGTVRPNLPTEAKECQLVMVEVIKMALADGRICRAEMQLIESLGQEMQYSTKADIEILVRKAKSEMYKESKVTLRSK